MASKVAEEADVTFEATDSDLYDILTGELDPTMAYFTVSIADIVSECIHHVGLGWRFYHFLKNELPVHRNFKKYEQCLYVFFMRLTLEIFWEIFWEVRTVSKVAQKVPTSCMDDFEAMLYPTYISLMTVIILLLTTNEDPWVAIQ